MTGLVPVCELRVAVQGRELRVELGLPPDAAGVVYLGRDNGNVIHGEALPFRLRAHGFGTAVCDLLTDEERRQAKERNRLPLGVASLARRLEALIAAVSDATSLGEPSAGIIASGTLAAAALRLASLRPLALDAIVCRRAKLESVDGLQHVRTPTLLLAVAGDIERIRSLTRAFCQLGCRKRFELVGGSSPSFDDERSFTRAVELSASWMLAHMGRAPTRVMMRTATL